MLLFYPLCYVAVLAYYAQYYAQKQEFCTAYYYTSLHKYVTTHITDNFRETVIIECIMYLPHVLSFIDCSIRVYRSFAATGHIHKCRNIAISELYLFPIMLTLCLMLSVTRIHSCMLLLLGIAIHYHES